jgi:hypothetical protein
MAIPEPRNVIWTARTSALVRGFFLRPVAVGPSVTYVSRQPVSSNGTGSTVW